MNTHAEVISLSGASHILLFLFWHLQRPSWHVMEDPWRLGKPTPGLANLKMSRSLMNTVSNPTRHLTGLSFLHLGHICRAVNAH